MGEPTRIAFAGTPDFAVPSLEALARPGVELTLVLTQPDRPAGRGRRLTASPVKHTAQRLGIAVQQPARLNDAAMPDAWGERPDLLVVVAYGLLLPGWALEWPRLGCVNVHASLLPRWRGAAPIQRALWAGDTSTGVSLMRVTRGLDCGPVYARQALAIDAQATGGELHDRLAAAGAALLTDNLGAIVSRRLVPEPQDEALATYAPKLGKHEAPLDWRAPAIELARQVRALNPWPIAEATLSDGRRLRIWAAEPVACAGDDAQGGQILAAGAAGIDVATGDGCLRLTSVQAPGAKAMPASAYLAAHPLADTAFVSR